MTPAEVGSKVSSMYRIEGSEERTLRGRLGGSDEVIRLTDSWSRVGSSGEVSIEVYFQVDQL